MIVRVYEETQKPDEPPKAAIGFQYDKKDAPGIAFYTSYPKRKLILALLKALWVTLTRK